MTVLKRCVRKNYNLIIAAGLLLNILSFGTVYAYFTSADYADNTFTVGNSEIEIIEEFLQDIVIPGNKITKKVSVENTGRCAAAVRVMVEFSDSAMKEFIELDFNNQSWELKEDGYYYYTEILQQGGITEKVFETVSVDEDAPAEKLKDFEIFIYAESVNADMTDDYRNINWQEVNNG